MLSTLRSVLNGVIEHPEDDSYRLILCDALEDAGQIERATFIRLQLKMAEGGRIDCPHKFPTLAPLPARLVRCGACDFCQSVLALKAYTDVHWEKAHPNSCWVETSAYYTLGYAYFEDLHRSSWNHPVDRSSPLLFFWRGFIHAARMTTLHWRKLRIPLVRDNPIERVELVDKTPMAGFGTGPPYWIICKNQPTNVDLLQHGISSSDIGVDFANSDSTENVSFTGKSETALQDWLSDHLIARARQLLQEEETDHDRDRASETA